MVNGDRTKAESDSDQGRVMWWGDEPAAVWKQSAGFLRTSTACQVKTVGGSDPRVASKR